MEKVLGSPMYLNQYLLFKSLGQYTCINYFLVEKIDFRVLCRFQKFCTKLFFVFDRKVFVERSV